FTAAGVWGFNERYLIGPDLLGLPLEEWLFFLVAPYACVFIHEVLRHFVPRDVLGVAGRPIALLLALLFLSVGLVTHERAYTATTLLGTALFLAYHALFLRSRWLGRFFLSYGVCLIPFLLVNGVLTGTFLPEPIVWYKDAENLGIRILTIPIEDSVYLMLLLLIVITFHERDRERRAISSQA
ncbi:MAG: lycopene cyclase domain-containing protein, partial [Flavobacteriales bacterium]|nr:lycopene cyclase domain-containing protein [Flavobacteriales bacterium]